MAVTLLTGAGLTILSFWNRTQVDFGVRTDHILTFGLPVNEDRFSSPIKSTASIVKCSSDCRSFPVCCAPVPALPRFH